MKNLSATVFAAMTCIGTPALAEFQTVQTREDFVAVVQGKTLTRPLVSIEVKPDGNISGTGAAWAVTGTWQWKDGYLCRSLAWGGDDLGYNCQEVKVNGTKVRITSDQGKGQSADFRLR